MYNGQPAKVSIIGKFKVRKSPLYNAVQRSPRKSVNYRGSIIGLQLYTLGNATSGNATETRFWNMFLDFDYETFEILERERRSASGDGSGEGKLCKNYTLATLATKVANCQSDATSKN